MQEVAVLEPREVVITTEQTDLIKHTICQGATDAEMKLFFFDCQRRGTHPLDKLIHFTKRDGKYTPVTSIDFFRLRAHSSGAYAGEGATTYDLAEDGLPDSCTVAVLRLVQGQVCTWRATARWKEYYPGEKSGFMWRKMPFLMLAKCAEALALRKAFPAELQGLYVKEEMDQAEPAPLATTKTFAEKFPEQAQKIQEKLNPPATVLEPNTNDILRDMGEQDGADKTERASVVATPATSDAAHPTNDPSAVYKARIQAATSMQEATRQYSATPETLRQEVWTVYQAALKGFAKKK